MRLWIPAAFIMALFALASCGGGGGIGEESPPGDSLTVTPLAGAPFSCLGTTTQGFLRGEETVEISFAAPFPAAARVVIEYIGEPALGDTSRMVVVDTTLPVDSLSGTLSCAWATTSEWSPGKTFPAGLYLIQAFRAGLPGQAAASATYYLDNEAPFGNAPSWGLKPVGPFGANLHFLAYPYAGFLREVEVAVMRQGEHPDTHTPVHRQTFTYPLEALVLELGSSFTWHPSSLPNGRYSGFMRVVDWAGNVSAGTRLDGSAQVPTPWLGSSTFIYFNLALDGVSGGFSPEGGQYRIDLGGRILSEGAAEEGRQVCAFVYRRKPVWPTPEVWGTQGNPFISDADGAWDDSLNPCSMLFDPGDLAWVYLYTTLGEDQIHLGSLSSTTVPASMAFAPPPHAPAILDPLVTVTPDGGDAYRIAVAGRLVDSAAGPTAGGTVRFHTAQRDREGSAKAEFDQDALTDGSGGFTATFSLTLAPGDTLTLTAKDQAETTTLGTVQINPPGWRWPCALTGTFK